MLPHVRCIANMLNLSFQKNSRLYCCSILVKRRKLVIFSTKDPKHQPDAQYVEFEHERGLEIWCQDNKAGDLS